MPETSRKGQNKSSVHVTSTESKPQQHTEVPPQTTSAKRWLSQRTQYDTSYLCAEHWDLLLCAWVKSTNSFQNSTGVKLSPRGGNFAKQCDTDFIPTEKGSHCLGVSLKKSFFFFLSRFFATEEKILTENLNGIPKTWEVHVYINWHGALSFQWEMKKVCSFLKLPRQWAKMDLDSQHMAMISNCKCGCGPAEAAAKVDQNANPGFYFFFCSFSDVQPCCVPVRIGLHCLLFYSLVSRRWTAEIRRVRAADKATWKVFWIRSNCNLSRTVRFDCTGLHWCRTGDHFLFLCLPSNGISIVALGWTGRCVWSFLVDDMETQRTVENVKILIFFVL